MTIAALEQALTFLSRTDLVVTARQQPLPSGVTELLKISSGDNEALLAAQESSRHSQEDIRHAAEFYVQQILFDPDGDNYRVLGVDPDDAETKIKLHYRLLVRWLHPDKNSSDWEVVFSERINRAWHALRTPERRREYDEQLSSRHRSATGAVPSREIKPAQWRENNSDVRFMSARTIKRLPVAVFSLLGVGALLALWLFSQMQPNLQAPVVSTNENLQPESRIQAVSNKSAEPEEVPVDTQSIPLAETAFNPLVDEEKDIPVIAEVAEPLPIVTPAKMDVPAQTTASSVKPPASLAVAEQGKKMKASAKTSANPVKPTEVAVVKKQAAPEKAIQPMNIAVASGAVVEENPVGKRKRKTKTELLAARQNETVVENAAQASNVKVAAVVNKPESQKEIASDASVRQFLQRFSRVYSEGDYFALHNLFTRDLTILGAPPQRTVLRSYRQLFEGSESREISLDHVTWLASDEHIVVIASYQAQVMPRGKAEAQSTHGDIRLDLRMENGQLRIIRLQSDSKNG